MPLSRLCQIIRLPAAVFVYLEWKKRLLFTNIGSWFCVQFLRAFIGFWSDSVGMNWIWTECVFCPILWFLAIWVQGNLLISLKFCKKAFCVTVWIASNLQHKCFWNVAWKLFLWKSFMNYVRVGRKITHIVSAWKKPCNILVSFWPNIIYMCTSNSAGN